MAITKFMRECPFEVGWNEKNPTRHPGFKIAFSDCLCTMMRDINVFCLENEIEHYEFIGTELTAPIDGCDCMVRLCVEIAHDNDNWKAI